MEWFSANWFQILTLLGVIVTQAVSHGVARAERHRMADDLGKLRQDVDAIAHDFQIHATNPDVHVNHILLKLFDERFDAIKTEQADTRIDVQRIETLLTSK